MFIASRLKKLILPPSGSLLAGFAGLALLASTPFSGSGIALIAASLVSLYLLSTPAIVSRWLESADRYPRFEPDEIATPAPAAIVILDGGRLNAPAERGGETVSASTLERLDEGARLHRQVDKPILVSGNGDLMARVLDDSFGVRPRWIESRSRTTHENALFSARILRRAGVEHVYLVTHFWHLRRSLAAFRHAGLEAVPVPAGRAGALPSERRILSFVPSVRMLSASYLLLHEWIGIYWYRIRYRYEDPVPVRAENVESRGP